MPPLRVLFVDDEPNIRLTVPAILSQHGFQVTVAATVADALREIHMSQFDVLLADLNIGEPGDGFTVVSAMRRTQPQAATVILTGYPAFESALRAIREQVDDFITKPTVPGLLVKTIQGAMVRRSAVPRTPAVRLFTVIAENKDEVARRWLERVQQMPEFASLQLSREQRLNHLPKLLEHLSELENGRSPRQEAAAETAAVRHGRVRREQGYSLPMLVMETRVLQHVIFQVCQERLLEIDLSYLLEDVMHVADELFAALGESISAYPAGAGGLK